MMARHVILFSQQQQQKVVFILRPSKQLGGNLIHFFFFPFPPTHCSLLTAAGYTSYRVYLLLLQGLCHFFQTIAKGYGS